MCGSTKGPLCDDGVRCQSDVVSTPGSHTCETAFKLLVPYIAAFLSYVRSMPTLVTTICGEHASYPTDPVCRPTTNIAGESQSNTVKLVLMPSQIRNLEVSITPTHCWMSLSPGWKCVDMCGMRWSADFVISINSIQKPTYLQRLNRDPMQVWIVTLDDFHACAIGSIRRNVQQRLMHKEGTLGTYFVTSILTSQF